MAERYVLDTSALLTLLEDEDGSDEVQHILKNEEVTIPFIVLLEVYYISLRKKGQRIADRRYAMLKSLNAEYIWEIDEPTILMAGKFKGLYKVSLADAIIAAITKSLNAILVHKDPEYEILKMEIKQQVLPYKVSQTN